MLVDSYLSRFTKENLGTIKEISRPLPWGEVNKILAKTNTYENVLKEIDKTVKKIVVAKIPEVKWSDIGGLDVAK